MRVASALVLLLTLAVHAETPDAAAVARANNAFTVDLYGRLAARDGNIIVSPFSISTALAMLHAGARGATAKEMETVLRFPFGGERLDAAYAAFLRDINGDGGKRPYDLTTANALWVQKDVALRKAYAATVRRQFGGRIENVDFGDAEAAASRINAWVSDATRKMIPAIVSPMMFSRATRTVLTNAIYLEATWREKFDPRQTNDAPFHLTPTRSVKVKTMTRTFHARRATVAGGRMLELPYAGDDLSMLLIIPDAVDGLAAIEKKLTPAALQQWYEKLESKRVSIFLPRFESSSSLVVNDQLGALGMKLPFSAGADFKGLAEGENLAISQVVHKARIIVDEVGTEAAAATAVVMVTSVAMPEKPEIFRADRPFLYMIRKESTGAILFIGRFARPE